MIDDESMKIQV